MRPDSEIMHGQTSENMDVPQLCEWRGSQNLRRMRKNTNIKNGDACAYDTCGVRARSPHPPKVERTPLALHTCRWCVAVSKPFLRSQFPVLVQWANRLQFFHLRLRDRLSHFLETLPDRRGVQFDLHRGLIDNEENDERKRSESHAGGNKRHTTIAHKSQQQYRRYTRRMQRSAYGSGIDVK